jgi:hypothetical protein
LRVTTLSGYTALPTEVVGVFDDPLTGNLLRSRVWLQNAEGNGLRPADRIRLFAGGEAPETAPAALLPALYSRLYASHPGARVLHFTMPEDQDYLPLLAEEQLRSEDFISAVLGALRAQAPSYDVIRVSPLAAGSPLATQFAAALRRTGHLLQVYRHPPARFVSLAGVSFQDYMGQRPRDLRESLDRSRRLMFDGGRGRFHFPCTRGLFEFSWNDIQKIVEATPIEGDPEPPGYLSSMMALAADCGALRVGMMYLDERPVAMQFWVVTDGVAHCLRIWGAQGPLPFPVDDLLTQMVLVCLIDGDRVTELDFGAIDDEFARNWAPMSRERMGIAAFTPRTLRGLRGAMRHVVPRYLGALPGRLWRKLAGRPAT